MEKSYLIITDSGGVQEEAPSLGKPVLVMRNTTERPEAVEAGTVCLVGTNTNKIIGEARRLLTHKESYMDMSRLHNPYGDGTACEKILDYIKNRFNEFSTYFAILIVGGLVWLPNLVSTTILITLMAVLIILPDSKISNWFLK